MAFTFDWTPEQYVPNLQGVLGTARSSVGSASVSDEEQFHLMGAAAAAEAAAAWPSEHRMFPLQPPPPPRLGLGLQPPAGRLDPESAEQTPAKGKTLHLKRITSSFILRDNGLSSNIQ
jgi:hypothetical protein